MAEYESVDEPVAKLGAVDADFARQLERELNAAHDRIQRLEEAGDEILRDNQDMVNVNRWWRAKETRP